MDEFLEKFNFSNLRFFWKAFSRYRFHIIWLGFLSVIGSFLEGVGINEILRVKGKGVPFMENNNIWHYTRLDPETYAEALSAVAGSVQ